MNSFNLLALLGVLTFSSLAVVAQGDYIPAFQVAAMQQQQQQEASPDNKIASPIDDDDEDDGMNLYSWSLSTVITGVDFDKLTPEHETYMEDALSVAFNQVHKNTELAALSSHLVTLKADDDDNDNNKMLRHWSRGKRIIGGWFGTIGCNLCNPENDRRFLLGATEVESSRAQERWERRYCRLLRDSGYAALREVDSCRFNMMHDGPAEFDSNFVGGTTSNAKVPSWRSSNKRRHT